MTSSHVALLAFLVVCIFFAKNPTRISGFSISLIPIDEVDKSMFPENLTLKKRYQRLAEISRARVHQLEPARSLSLGKSKQTEPYTLQPRITRDYLGYFITSLMVGSQSYAPYLMVDTGSDTTWMQCEGCTKCFHIKQGNFNRHASKSYQALPCDDPLCFPRICKHGFCMYRISYVGTGTGSSDCYTNGEMGLDTFGFPDKNGVVKRFPRTVFGCGLENGKFHWDYYGQNNVIAGVLGLATGQQSILRQYRNETKLRMSYCLPRKDSSTSSAVLQFGDEAQIRGRAWTTRLLPVPRYAINVMGISVGARRLAINPSIFRMKPDGTGGFVFDTGSFLTVLVRTAYIAVKNEMIRFFQDRFQLHPQPPQGTFDLCHDVPSGNYTFPTMTFHFDRANLLLDWRNIFQTFGRGFCLMMMPIPDDGTSLLGSFQQANYRFLFDFNATEVSFIEEVCH